MKNYIVINNQQIELTEEQVKLILAANNTGKTVKLAEVPVGEVVKIGGYELLVLEQMGESTALICKDLLEGEAEFGENNNYDGSYVDDICGSFAEALEVEVGEDNILTREVDLTSDDGLKDYGKIERRASLLTTELYRRYVEVLDKFKTNNWWWLATPHSTEKHGNNSWIKCVSPSGYIDFSCCNGDYCGVRPFCILKSDIFVSK